MQASRAHGSWGKQFSAGLHMAYNATSQSTTSMCANLRSQQDSRD